MTFVNLLFDSILSRLVNLANRRALLVRCDCFGGFDAKTLTSNILIFPQTLPNSPESSILQLRKKCPKFAPAAFRVKLPHPCSENATRGHTVRTVANYCSDSFSVLAEAVIFCFLAGFLSDIISIKSLTFCGTTLP